MRKASIFILSLAILASGRVIETKGHMIEEEIAADDTQISLVRGSLSIFATRKVL